MKHNFCFSQTRGRTALLSMMVLLLVAPFVAATDLQIMVSGSWAYVTDPSESSRVFIVSPKSHFHHAYILPGTGADTFGQSVSPPIDAGLYRLDFDPRLRTTHIGKRMKHAVLVPFAVSRAQVSTVLWSTSNYIISLPAPDDWTEYVDPTGNFSGHSESKVALNVVTPTSPASGKNYTTWMVLHYSVKTLPPSLQLAGGATQTILTTDGQNNHSGGISIVLGDPVMQDNDPKCDSVSLESFNAQNVLWHQTRHVLFPIQDKDNNGKWHQTHQYDYNDCTDYNRKIGPKQNESGGGADCHDAQINVNNALQ
jgi:hypothetical protein